jgi:hypothetical protein
VAPSLHFQLSYIILNIFQPSQSRPFNVSSTFWLTLKKIKQVERMEEIEENINEERKTEKKDFLTSPTINAL